jgi:hypothetical protein
MSIVPVCDAVFAPSGSAAVVDADGSCQCGLNFPQNGRLKIPHFVSVVAWRRGGATVLGAIKGRALKRAPLTVGIP